MPFKYAKKMVMKRYLKKNENVAAAATEQLLPEKSKFSYENGYTMFIEDIILPYLAEKVVRPYGTKM